MSTFFRLLAALAVAISIAVAADAHEVRPAYLEITEQAPSTFAMVLKQPLRSNEPPRMGPVLPDTCTKVAENSTRAAGVLIQRWSVSCDLRQGVLKVEGLDGTLSDVFVRMERSGEAPLLTVLRAGHDTIDLDPAEATPGVWSYFGIGIDHILAGYDHLLFVLGLMLLVSLRQVLPAITAFTLAHSLTLGGSAVGGLSLPGPPVEISIALSIAFLASEAARKHDGRLTVAARRPWLIAFGFGLLHGFGFAGALSEIGLPESARLAALLLFNLGVEAGQIIVVVVVLALSWTARIVSAEPSFFKPVRTAVIYVIGTTGMFWAIERAAGAFLV